MTSWLNEEKNSIMLKLKYILIPSLKEFVGILRDIFKGKI